MLYRMVDKGGCKKGLKAPEGSPKGGCKEGLKAKPKKKLVLKQTKPLVVKPKRKLVLEPQPEYAKKKPKKKLDWSLVPKVIAPKPRVPMVAKVMKAKPKQTMGQSLTGLTKEQMNKLSPLELFGMLPVAVSKVVLDPKTTGVKVAQQNYTNNDLIDLVLQGAGRKEMPTKKFILEYGDKTTDSPYMDKFPSDERRQYEKKMANFWREVKKYMKMVSGDEFKPIASLPTTPRLLIGRITGVTGFLNRNFIKNVGAKELQKKMKMELFRLGSKEYRNKVISTAAGLKKSETTSKDKESMEKSLEEMKDSDFKVGMTFELNGERWYGDGPGQGGGWKDQLWELTKSNNKTGKVTLKFIRHRGSSAWMKDEPIPKQKTKTIFLNKIWDKRHTG